MSSRLWLLPDQHPFFPHTPAGPEVTSPSGLGPYSPVCMKKAETEFLVNQILCPLEAQRIGYSREPLEESQADFPSPALTTSLGEVNSI